VSVVVVGLNHHTVPLEVLERTTVVGTRLPKALHDLAGRSHLSEVVVLSTCGRTEVYAVVGRFHPAVGDVRHFLTTWSGGPPELFSDHLYEFYEDAAVSHLFKVAAGVDSAVLGEGEILGQVRAAWQTARSEGVAGPVLDRLFRHAVEAGKRVRSETGIARGITSLSQAAVAMATERLDSLEGRDVLVIGAGDVGESMATALAAVPGIGRIDVANRTWSKAAELATRINARPVRLGQLPDALEQADVVLTSTGSTGMLLEAADLVPIMTGRPGRPLLLVDVAVPRDVDPAAGTVPGVTLLDMADIQRFAEAGMAERRKELGAVQAIINDEVQRYLAVATQREAAPLIAALRDRAEAMRLAELARYRTRLAGLDPRQQEAVDALTRGLLGKLLHEPTVQLKDAAGSPHGDELADALRALFDL